MSSNTHEVEYIRAEEKIYDVATNKDIVDWKNFLYELINNEGLDPWNIDLGILTKKYIESLKELRNVDFNVSGKFLTIAVFLLKTKTDVLIERDIRGIENTIADLQSNSDDFDNLEDLEGLDLDLDEGIPKKKKYVLKYRNPIARKRKVTIFDLIKTLEKTFEQSNKRRANFLQRKASGRYDGPMYEKRPKDLKQLIEELYDFIVNELSSKAGHVHFSKIVDGIGNKMEILEKFIPLLHLTNHGKVALNQDEHFGEIKIEKIFESSKE